MTIIIIGAGPTGLTAAIELARRGIIPRLIDRKPEPSRLSRAVGINPQSLHLLEPSGITPRLLAAGIKIRYGTLHEAGRDIATLRLGLLPPPYDFLLSLPQDETERVMQKRFEELGGRVEYNTALENLTFLPEGRIALDLVQEGRRENAMADIVIGADGAHSLVRQFAGIAFDGYDRAETWSIADVDLSGAPYDPERAHLFLGSGAFGFMIRIEMERYRIVASQPDAVSAIPGLAPYLRAVHGANDFHIAVRQAATYQRKGIFLAGDAAHVHTPAGALGMNTGIADACDLARRFADGDLAGYTAARHKVGREVIAFSERLVFVAQLRHSVMRLIRRFIFPLLLSSDALQKHLLRRIAGRPLHPEL